MGAKTPKTSDRRVQRTRRTLREALIELILERGFETTSVQDVCERADVGRSTFYMHFADKEDLLLGGFEDLRKALRHQLAASPAGSPLPFAHGMIQHAYEQQRLFRALVGKRTGQVVLRRFRELVLTLVAEDLTAMLPAGLQRDVAACFIAGGFLEVLTWWLEKKPSLAPAEVARMFLELARPALGR
jgi:AcrR family transcriptional regulator